MNKEIRFSGYTAAPSDYECPDGTLALALNLINEDGTLRPIQPPTVAHTFPEGQTPVYIHRTTRGDNYILTSTTTEGKTSYHSLGETIHTLGEQETATDIASLGNTLVISTSKAIHYLYFSGQHYVYLGDSLPRPRLGFRLRLHPVSSQHKAELTYTEFTSADQTWENFATLNIECDLEKKNPNPQITTILNDDVPVSFPQPLSPDTEYKFTVRGEYFIHFYLYGKPAGSDSYEELFLALNNKVKIYKVLKQYESYKAKVVLDYGGLFNPVNPVFHAKLSITVQKGFTADITGKVIEYNEKNYNALAAAINKFTATQGTHKNRFIHPFFIRYALHLTDGSDACISAPILIVPNSGYTPIVHFKPDSKEITLYAFAGELQVCLQEEIDPKWRDFIAGINIYASAPAYPYKQGQEFDPSENHFSYAIRNKDIDQISDTSYGYGEITEAIDGAFYGCAKVSLTGVLKKLYQFGNTDNGQEYRTVRLAPNRGQLKDLAETASFHLIKSYAFDELHYAVDDFGDPVFMPAELSEGTLDTLQARLALTDDPLSAATFLNARLTTYNQRLHLYDYSLRHPQPQHPAQQTAEYHRESLPAKRVTVHIRTAQGERTVIAVPPEGSNMGDKESNPWFFYPHNGAYKATITHLNYKGHETQAVLHLRTHPHLNGAYWMADSLDGTYQTSLDAELNDTPDDISHYPNSVLLSNTASPFSFPASYMVTLGAGKILGMSTAAKALSQGQFGQFPLYAFTDQGVWALEVSQTGTYAARQPITRDVCINPAGITQLDNAVLFPTARGIMHISGSQTECITDPINTDFPFRADDLPALHTLLDKLGDSEGEVADCLPSMPFSSFLTVCRIIYDYPHQRLIVYAPSRPCAYVCSLKTRLWGMVLADISSHLNAYPSALAVDTSGRVLDFSSRASTQAFADSESTRQVNALYVTRPLKLEAPDTLKTVDTVLQRGHFLRGDVTTVLYGSRDLVHWHIIWSSSDHVLRGMHGTPYKYFRIAATAVLSQDKSIHGASITMQPRDTNTLR